MRGIDALAAACAPKEDPAAAGTETTNNLSDEMCEKIAQKVLQKLQAGLTDTEKPEEDKEDLEHTEAPAEDPEEGESENDGD